MTLSDAFGQDFTRPDARPHIIWAPMSGTEKQIYKDVIIVGGGLSGCLLFYFLKKRFPHFKIALFEKNNLCGNHTWSLHNGDVPVSLQKEFNELLSMTWSSYDVYFPEYSRHLHSGYASLFSSDLAQKITAVQTSEDVICEQTSVEVKSETTVQVGETTWTAHWVVDCTGWRELTGPLGYQKFVGLELEFPSKHNLKDPILKDVRVPQTDGYRFMYALPFSDTKLLLEDTYYSNSPELDHQKCEEEILSYARQYFPGDFKILRREEGCLPLCLSQQKMTEYKTLRLGAASLFYHPVTGYSIPQTLQMLEQLMNGFAKKLSAAEMLLAQTKFYEQKAASLSFLLMLNRMLFLAAAPEKRYIVLQRFYKLPEELIHRFFRGEVVAKDQFRILIGKPPVSVLKALKAIFY